MPPRDTKNPSPERDPAVRTVDRDALHAWMNEQLDVGAFRDWAPNGLQVEGRATIARVVTGVTANLDLIEAAVALGADALLVHHGMFWERELRTLTGWKRRRVAALLANDINLFAYHLPLDAHPEVGNNAVLARALGLAGEETFGGSPAIGRLTRAPETESLRTLAERVAEATGQTPRVFAGPEGLDAPVRRVAIVTGGGDSFHEEAAGLGADVLLSGEAAENSQALARETGCAFISAGHHATERFGPRAFGDRIREVWGVEVVFHDIPNPV